MMFFFLLFFQRILVVIRAEQAHCGWFFPTSSNNINLSDRFWNPAYLLAASPPEACADVSFSMVEVGSGVIVPALQHHFRSPNGSGTSRRTDVKQALTREAAGFTCYSNMSVRSVLMASSDVCFS